MDISTKSPTAYSRVPTHENDDEEDATTHVEEQDALKSTSVPAGSAATKKPSTVAEAPSVTEQRKNISSSSCSRSSSVSFRRVAVALTIITVSVMIVFRFSLLPPWLHQDLSNKAAEWWDKIAGNTNGDTNQGGGQTADDEFQRGRVLRWAFNESWFNWQFKNSTKTGRIRIDICHAPPPLAGASASTDTAMEDGEYLDTWPYPRKRTETTSSILRRWRSQTTTTSSSSGGASSSSSPPKKPCWLPDLEPDKSSSMNNDDDDNDIDGQHKHTRNDTDIMNITTDYNTTSNSSSRSKQTKFDLYETQQQTKKSSHRRRDYSLHDLFLLDVETGIPTLNVETIRSRCLRGTHTLFLGDSLMRYQYMNFAHYLHTGKWEANRNTPANEKERDWESWNKFYKGTNGRLGPWSAYEGLGERFVFPPTVHLNDSSSSTSGSSGSQPSSSPSPVPVAELVQSLLDDDGKQVITTHDLNVDMSRGSEICMCYRENGDFVFNGLRAFSTMENRFYVNEEYGFRISYFQYFGRNPVAYYKSETVNAPCLKGFQTMTPDVMLKERNETRRRRRRLETIVGSSPSRSSGSSRGEGNLPTKSREEQQQEGHHGHHHQQQPGGVIGESAETAALPNTGSFSATNSIFRAMAQEPKPMYASSSSLSSASASSISSSSAPALAPFCSRQGHMDPTVYNFTNSSSSATCPQENCTAGSCGKPQNVSLPLPIFLQNAVAVGPVTTIFINCGLWDCDFDKPAAVENFFYWLEYLQNATFAKRVVWKTTTQRCPQETRDYNTLQKDILDRIRSPHYRDLGWRIFDVHTLTTKLLQIPGGFPFTWWDCLHYYPWVYRGLNEALLLSGELCGWHDEENWVEWEE